MPINDSFCIELEIEKGKLVMRLKIVSLLSTMLLTMAIMTGCTGTAAKIAQEVFDAYDSGDAKKAQQIYLEEIQGSEENEKAFDEKLNHAMESIVDNYNEEIIDMDTAREQISHYVDVFGESTCLMDGYESLKVIQSSKASYAKAKKLDEKEEYAKAYTLYESVSEKDSNYEDAQERLSELLEILAKQAEQGKEDTAQYLEKHESRIKLLQRYDTSPKTSDKSAGNSSSGTVTQEYKNALSKGLQYANQLHMSKKAIYDQLTSSYGEGFAADAAQYAIDNMTGIDWNANTLEKAKQYYYNMSMSKSAVYDQLTSEYGEQFTTSEAQYAIDHLN